MSGRIDRIDLARDEEGKAYLRVIDYKSNFSLAEIFYGYHFNSLPIWIALTFSRQCLKSCLPAGMFYFRIYAPLVNVQNRITEDGRQRTAETFQDERPLVWRNPKWTPDG